MYGHRKSHKYRGLRLLKGVLISIVLIVAIAPTIGDAARPIVNVTNEPIPAKADGTSFSSQEIQSIILNSCNERDWSPEFIEDGIVRATLNVRNRHYAIVEISFAPTEYSITYLSSIALDYEERKQRIHKNYNVWVNELREAINKNIHLSSYSAGSNALEVRSNRGARVLPDYVTQLSPDTFVINQNSKAGMFANMGKLKAKVHKLANEFADQEGRTLVLVSERSDRPNPGFPWYELTFRLVDPVATISGSHPNTEAEAIEAYLVDHELDLIEGIWTWGDNRYQIALIQNNTGIEPEYDYVGIVIRADQGSWKPGQIKVFLNSTAIDTIFTGVYFDGNQVRTNLSYILEDPNLLKVNYSFDGYSPLLIRDYPVGRSSAKARSSGTESHGTCFIVGPNGTAITSHHVVDGTDRITVTLSDGRQLPAMIEKSSAATDLAVLRISASTPDYLSFTSTKSVQLGDQVFTVGFPTKSILGSEAKFTEGSISALSGIHGEASYMQVSVPIQPGNSGGPVVNYSGNVVGVIAATAAVKSFYKATGSLPQNVNWAVKSDYVQIMLGEVPARPTVTGRADAIKRTQAAVCQVVATH